MEPKENEIDYSSGVGGNAFPGEQGHTPYGTWNQTWDPGMNLLDYFAGQALANIAGTDKPATRIATACYDFAQAMLTESLKRREEM